MAEKRLARSVPVFVSAAVAFLLQIGYAVYRVNVALGGGQRADSSRMGSIQRWLHICSAATTPTLAPYTLTLGLNTLFAVGIRLRDDDAITGKLLLLPLAVRLLHASKVQCNSSSHWYIVTVQVKWHVQLEPARLALLHLLLHVVE